jgi:hypothetical protein
MAVSFSTLRDRRPLHPGRFLVLISVRGWVYPKAIVWLEELSQLKKSNDVIGNQTSDLLTCSIMPQPITLPRAPTSNMLLKKKRYIYVHIFIYTITWLQSLQVLYNTLCLIWPSLWHTGSYVTWEIMRLTAIKLHVKSLMLLCVDLRLVLC